MSRLPPLGRARIPGPLSAVVAGMLSALGLPAVSIAGTITVCESGCEYTEVAQAIQVAAQGDVVAIGEGTYNLTGSSVFYDITLRGTGDTTVLEGVGDPAIEHIANANLTIEAVQLQGDGGLLIDASAGSSTTLRDVTHVQPEGRAPTTLISFAHPVVMESVALVGNPAEASTRNVITAQNGTLLLSNCVIRNHHGYQVIALRSVSSVEVDNCLIEQNSLESAVFSLSTGARVHLTDITLRDNEFTGDGAAFLVNRANDFLVVGMNAHDNQAERGGILDLVRVSAGDVRNSSFRRNTAQRGPALTMGLGSLTLHGDVVFAENSAIAASGIGGDGGAVYVRPSGSLTLEGTTFLNNEATAMGGAVAFAQDAGPAQLFNLVAQGNRAAQGGALSLAGSPFAIVAGGLFSNNIATERGGAILCAAPAPFYAQVELSQSLFLNNLCTGPSGPCPGGAIATTGESFLGLFANWFQGNQASEGGGIHQEVGCGAYGFESVFYQNQASDDGGAFAVQNCQAGSSPAHFEQSFFVENEAGGFGGALRINQHAVELINNTWVGNTAGSSGTVSFDGTSADVNNSLFMGSTGSAVHATNQLTAGQLRYFGMYENDADFTGDAAGTSVAVSDDPLLAGWPPEDGATDPHAIWRWLAVPGSPTINTGDPALSDRDNTRSDIGVFSGTFDTSPLAVDRDNDGWPAAFDCDDDNAEVHPEAAEVCDELDVDEDCNRVADDSDPGIAQRPTWFLDADGDGVGDTDSTLDRCEQPPGYALGDGDCDDTDADVSPAAIEQPYDGVDNDCDPATPDDDLDEDGVLGADDCDDENPAVYPGATEICNDVDDDCSGDVDSDAVDRASWYADLDEDSFGDPSLAEQACAAPDGFVDNDADCNDNDASVKPGATEVCNGTDDDCSGDTDSDAVDQRTWFADADSDTYGDSENTTLACDQPDGFAANAGDCDDTSAERNPDAQEFCNALDNDCDGAVDNNAIDLLTWYADADADGFGDLDASVFQCTQPGDFVADSTDCDDANSAINPSAEEVCNELDDDCSGNVDSDAIDRQLWFDDADGDGFGDPDTPELACSAPAGFVDDDEDCDDSSATSNPDATEVAYDGIDQDCDGSDLVDVDGDGHEGGGGPDCNDADDTVFPGAEEVADDGIDQDCSGADASAGLIDADGDGHPAETDCDDNDPSTHPGAEELPGTRVDHNCDGWLVQQHVAGVTPFSCSSSGTPLQAAPWLILLALARRRSA